MHRTEIAIVGTGPYGLSLGAHLHAAGLPFRIIGRVMETWREQMPQGMLLKSDGFASDLSDPHGVFKLHHYCEEQRVPYHATCIPVKLSAFAGYGVEFQRRMVPEVEEAKLVRLEQGDGEFLLTLDTGETFVARKVVLAIGISYYARIPPILSGLPAEGLCHSSQVPQPAVFAGKRLAVVGSGASAIDLSALLHEAGAQVTIVSRRNALKFHDKPKPGERSLWEKLRRPGSGLGPGWKGRLLTEFPHWYRLLPASKRLELLRRLLGPSGGWPMRERVEGKVRVLPGVTPRASEMRENGVLLALGRENGTIEQLEVEHVIAATGYQVDLRRLPFLAEELRQQIRVVEQMPVLSSHFESSVPGLYFVGISSALTFGPMMRFAYGAAYTAQRLKQHLQRRSQRRTVYDEQTAAVV
ncbi:MAG TPA: NAD(P)-binding domain-containing protein [Acidobacteriaceae bacterium]|jgi:thioredoxin reductase